MTWTEVSITVPRPAVDVAIGVLLRRVPHGLVDDARPRARLRTLRVYLPSGGAGRSPLTRLRRELTHLHPSCRVQARQVRDESWRDAWKAHARPVRVGRMTVLPSWWRDREDRGQVVLRIDPGQAFGSGEHPSTQLCLDAVTRYARRGATVIDVGTGSGILAIAAARLGAARVLAVDNDPLAVRVARANARTNGVASCVQVRRGDGLSGVRLRADVIVANLTAETLPAILRQVSQRLTPGGRFVGAGFGPARVREVVRAVRASGLHVVEITARRGWRGVHATPLRPRVAGVRAVPRR